MYCGLSINATIGERNLDLAQGKICTEKGHSGDITKCPTKGVTFMRGTKEFLPSSLHTVHFELGGGGEIWGSFVIKEKRSC